MRFLKPLLVCSLFFISFFHIWSMIYAFSPVTPLGLLSFKSEFADPLLKESKAWEKLFDLHIDTDQGLFSNMKKIFYPTDGDNTLRIAIRNIMVWVLLVFLVWAGVHFLLFAPWDAEELKRAWKNLIFIIYGAALIFLVVRLLWTALNLGGIQGATWEWTTLLKTFEDNVLVFILSFLKWFAFFMAIIFLIWYGYRMMQAFSEEEKLKAARTGILNVFIALILIKIIDYVYFVAQQHDFKNAAIEFIVQASKFLWYLWGIMFVIALVYAWYQFITAWWNDDKITKAKTVIKSVFVIILIILLFMLVIYQVFNDIL